MLVLQEVWCQSIYLYIIYNYVYIMCINLFSCCSSLSWFEPHFKAIGCGWQAGVNGDRNQHQSTIPALAAYEYAVLPGRARNQSVTLCQECHKWWICQQDWPSKSFNNVYSSTSVIKAVFKVVQIHRQTETGCGLPWMKSLLVKTCLIWRCGALFGAILQNLCRLAALHTAFLQDFNHKR